MTQNADYEALMAIKVTLIQAKAQIARERNRAMDYPSTAREVPRLEGKLEGIQLALDIIESHRRVLPHNAREESQ